MSTPPGSTESIPARGVGKTGNHGGALRWGIKRAASKLQARWILGPARSRPAPRAPLSPEARAEIRRILVIAYPPGLGDTLAATPFFSALKDAFPAAQVSALAAGPNAEILRRSGGRGLILGAKSEDGMPEAVCAQFAGAPEFVSHE